MFVSLERRGASVSAIINIANVSHARKSQIGAGSHGGANVSIISASSSVAFQNELNEAVRSGRASVQVTATGGQGLGSLGQIVLSSTVKTDPLTQIAAALGEYMKQFDKNNAVPIGFQATPLDQLGGPEMADLWSDTRQGELKKLVERYRAMAAAVDAIDGIVSGGDPRSVLVDSAKKAELVGAKAGIEHYRDILAKRHTSCKSARSRTAMCSMPPDTAPDLTIIPAMPPHVHLEYGPTVGSLTEDQFDDGAEAVTSIDRVSELRSIHVSYGGVVDGLQLFYKQASGPDSSPGYHGGGGGQNVTITLNSGEIISRVEGMYGSTPGYGIHVYQLVFHTNQGRSFGPYGNRQFGNDETTFSFGPPGKKVVAFSGYARRYINALGPIYLPQ
jgi:hypothetical protein